jgi:hypothetical protein
MLSKEGSMKRATCTNDIEQAYRKRAECRDELLRFYYSKKRVKEIRKKQVLAKNSKKSLAREDVETPIQKRLLMFTSDKGTGIISRIKRH